ncbi:MAG: hypothetical protein KDJ65_23775 [Anaerolineae bacterium]|nr:hypothetical protein [Anaerolineae bacterium]
MPSLFTLPAMKLKLASAISESELIQDKNKLDIFGILNLIDTDPRSLATIRTACNESLSEDEYDNNLDFNLIEKYTGTAISTAEQAEENYCNALVNFRNIYGFTYKNDFKSFFYILHLTAIMFGAWFVFVNPLMLEKFSNYFAIMFFIALLIFFVAFIVLTVLDIKDDQITTLVYATFVWGPSFFILWQIVGRKNLKEYSMTKSYSLATFPLALFSSALMLAIVIDEDLIGILILSAAIISFLFIPYIKGQFIELLALPKNIRPNIAKD